jgi:ADP-L-glycero-D-manno-heptose 6-epimerase
MFLVTGGAGFIGSNVVASLNEAGRTDVVVNDRLGTAEKWRNLAKREIADVVPPDDLARWLDGVRASGRKLDAVIHMGANSDTTARDADEVIASNFRLSLALLDWCTATRTPFVYASSAATYGDGSAGMDDLAEDISAWRPLNAYGWSKQVFDVHAQREGFLRQIVGLKYFNIFGPNEEHKGDMRSVVSKAWRQIEETGQVRLFKSYDPHYPDGGQKRDFLYVKDAVRMTLHLAATKKAGGLFNIGSGHAHTWLELVHPIFEALRREPRIEFIDMPEELRSQYQYFTQADVTKLKSTGYSGGVTPLRESVVDYVGQYLVPDKRFGDGAGE